MSVLFVICTGLKWNGKHAKLLCAPIFFKDMVQYMAVIGKLHNDE